MKSKLSLSSECVETKLCKPCTSFTWHLHSWCGMVWYKTLRVTVRMGTWKAGNEDFCLATQLGQCHSLTLFVQDLFMINIMRVCVCACTLSVIVTHTYTCHTHTHTHTHTYTHPHISYPFQPPFINSKEILKRFVNSLKLSDIEFVSMLLTKLFNI